MDIAIVTDVYAQLSGIGKYIDILMKGLRKDHVVKLYTPSNFFSIPIPYGYKISIPHGTLKEDVVHAQTPYVLGPWALTRGRPNVVTTHTFPENLNILSYIPFANRFLARYYNMAERLICQTKEVHELLSTIGVRDPDYIIPNPFDFDFCKGVDPSLFKDTFGIEGPFVFASFRLSDEKNPIDFVKLAALMPDVNFVLGGKGPQEEMLKRMATANVTFVGFLTPELLKSGYKACEFLVHPSLAEMFGYSIVEAMAFSKPVILKNICNFNFLGDSVFRYDEVADLKEKTQRLLEDKAERTKAGKKAFEKIKEYDVWKIAPKVIKVYEDVLESHK